MRKILTIATACAVLLLPFADPAFAAKAKPKKKSNAAAATQLVALPKPERPQLVVDAATGAVIHAREARTLWHPASLTKMMTAYVAFRAIQTGRVRFDAPLVVSANATIQKPSKMGFKPGSLVTLEAALYMIMVKSANDMAVAIAEGISGSVPAFVTEMNAWSQQLGMTDTVWANPNGLPDERQITSARDMAILARALYRDFPELQPFLKTPAIQVGNAVMKNHNPLLGRFEGADGLKTGYICDSGFNIVASATRRGRRYIAVVMGADSAKARDERTALLLEKAFSNSRAPGQGFFNSNASQVQLTLGSLPHATRAEGGAVKMKKFICGRNKRTDMEDVMAEISAFAPSGNISAASYGLLQMSHNEAAKQPAARQRLSLLAPRPANLQPLVIAVDQGDQKRNIPLRAALAGRNLPPLPPGIENYAPMPLTAPPPEKRASLLSTPQPVAQKKRT